MTGCTHVIGFYRPGQAMVELIADGSAMLPKRGRLLEMPFRGERDHECSGRNSESGGSMVQRPLEQLVIAVRETIEPAVECSEDRLCQRRFL